MELEQAYRQLTLLHIAKHEEAGEPVPDVLIKNLGEVTLELSKQQLNIKLDN